MFRGSDWVLGERVPAIHAHLGVTANQGDDKDHVVDAAVPATYDHADFHRKLGSVLVSSWSFSWLSNLSTLGLDQHPSSI